MLEHIVDTVLYFEGDTHSSFRLVRAIKNRFGAVNEIGVFAMTERGLLCVSPSKYSTVSTMCSSTRGPASAPSLVTWPTKTMATPLVLARRVSCAAHSRTCDTEPGAEVSWSE